MITCDLSMSLDGYVAGPNQTVDDPIGQGGEELHRWMFEDTESNRFERETFPDNGAFIMGRNMFGPIQRGAWDEDWKGWWGDNPPYHAPVFVVTHYPREPIEMEGGTTYHFVTEGPEAALKLAQDAAGSKPVAISGGANIASQFLNLGVVDELRIHLSPIVLGGGESIWNYLQDVDLEIVSAQHAPLVTHITYRPQRRS